MKQTAKVFAIFVLLVFTAVGFGAGFLAGQGTVRPVYLEGVRNIEEGKPAGVDFSLFWSAWDTLSRRYVASEKLDYEKMTYGAISGMVESLGDPHTIFLAPGEAKGFLEDVEGKFEGVGMEIGVRDGMLKVVAPLEGTPAQRAGLRPGDVLITIAGKPAADMKSEEAVKLIRGPKGTKVTISVLREGWDAPKEFTIERGVIEVPALKWELRGALGEKKVAYIKLYQFSEKAGVQFQKAVSEIAASDADRIVLDLRNNPGGFLHISQDIAGWFLERDQIVLIEDFASSEQPEVVHKTQGNPLFLHYPVVVLMNEGSASASEILAGALRDNRKIKIVGEQSFGKGSVQELEWLRDKSALKITIAYWYTPLRTKIEGTGLTPDIPVSITDEDFDKGRDPQLERALEVVRGL